MHGLKRGPKWLANKHVRNTELHVYTTTSMEHGSAIGCQGKESIRLCYRSMDPLKTSYSIHRSVESESRCAGNVMHIKNNKNRNKDMVLSRNLSISFFSHKIHGAKRTD